MRASTRGRAISDFSKPLAIVAATLLLGGATPGAAALGETPKQALSGAMDYMVQAVCIDGGGRVQRLSPLDPACTRTRKLNVGELLPYHKHDWPSRANADAFPQGMQRADSVPLWHPQLGLVAFTTFDWGDGVRRFGVYDGVNGDGGGLVADEGGFVGSAMTIDHTAGVQIFVNGATCRGTVSFGSLLGWRFAPSDLSAQPSGTTSDDVRRVSGLGEPCPVRYAHAITVWYLTDYAPMRGPDVVGQRTIRTLVSEHYSGVRVDASPNMERMYFSRELGRFRWERWQNQAIGVRPIDQRLSTALQADGRCIGGVGAPKHQGQWTMVRCHEWTNIVPATMAAGDSIVPWLDGLIAGTRAVLLQDVTP
jgi:hypothetical protein